MKRLFAALAILVMTTSVWAEQRYPATGMVLSVDPAHKSFVASCQAIPGIMGAMNMPFEVHQSKELTGLVPGAIVEFTLVVDHSASYAEHLQVRTYQTAEQDPWAARQLKLFAALTEKSKSALKPLEIGKPVPNFTLSDQIHQKV